LTDILTPEQRSAQMSRIKGKDTKIEVLVRKALHARGFRYRLGGRGLPGRPDLVLPKYRAVILVHGCFWHGHHCHLFRWPKTRPDFWREKIGSNKLRDARTFGALKESGWRPIEVWECSIRGQPEREKRKFFDLLASSIRNG